MRFPFAALVLVLAFVRSAAAGEVVETWEDGTPRLRYVVDEAGVRTGPFVEYFPGGKPAVKGSWSRDKLEGLWTAFHENGKPKEKGSYRADKRVGKWESWTDDGALSLVSHWKEGLRDGKTESRSGGEVRCEQVWKRGVLLALDGAVAFPKPRADIERTLQVILGPAPDRRAPYDLATDREAALRRLRAYRYVCDVPYLDVTSDPAMEAHAQAASRLCAELGHITHEPTNPGWPKDEFAFAAEGCKNCNLDPVPAAVGSVDDYMNDSDPTNIDRVGHRCWCLNPAMLRTGFGAAVSKESAASAMWSLDYGRVPAPEPDAVTFPTRGWMPLDLFAKRYAWSVALPKARWKDLVPQQVRAVVQPLDTDALPVGAPLELDYLRAAEGAPGMGWLVIFRPKELALADGLQFQVTIGPLGPAPARGKPAPTLRFLVAFFRRPEAPKEED